MNASPLYSLEKKLSQGSESAKSIVNGFAKRLFEEAVSRKQKVFFVYGMRRSGNHACINWLVNSLEGQHVHRINCEGASRFSYTESGDTFVMNEVNVVRNRTFIRMMLRTYSAFARAKFLIISAEDVAPDYSESWRIPGRSKKICVRRKTVNLLASRYQSLNRYASMGRSKNDMKMDDEFTAQLQSLQRDHGDHVFEFESWSRDQHWRNIFLENLGLATDLSPEMSREGGGSSFTGSAEISKKEELEKRFLTVHPRKPWQEFLENYRTTHPDLFTEEELTEVDQFLSKTTYP